MPAAPDRRSVDLAAFPGLVMIMLGFRLKGWRGLRVLRELDPALEAIAREKPDGLLAHEGLRFGLIHVGMRQYWRDWESLERFTRTDPHAGWWRRIRELSASAGFWHETWHARGGVEALYVSMPAPVGLQLFAPERAPDAAFVGARARVQGGMMEPAQAL